MALRLVPLRKPSAISLREEALTRGASTCNSTYIAEVTASGPEYDERRELTLAGVTRMGADMLTFMQEAVEVFGPGTGVSRVEATLMYVFGAVALVCFTVRAGLAVRDEVNVIRECFAVRVNPLNGKRSRLEGEGDRVGAWHRLRVLWRVLGHVALMALSIGVTMLVREAMTVQMQYAGAACRAVLEVRNSTALSGLAVARLLRGDLPVTSRDDITLACMLSVWAASSLVVGVEHGDYRCLGNEMSVLEVSQCITMSQRLGMWAFALSHLDSPANSLARRTSEMYLASLALPDTLMMASEHGRVSAALWLYNLAVDRFRNAKLWANVGIGAASALFGLFIAFEALYVLGLRERREELSRLFRLLDPTFIAGNAELMRFVRVAVGVQEVDPEIGVFDDCGIGLLVLNDSGQILSFTRQVQTLFGYRAEQMLGQNLSVLVPRSGGDHNAIGFYQQFQSVKRRQADASFTREVLGRQSDGAVIPVRAQVTLSPFQNADYFLVELKSEAALSLHDEAIQELTSAYQAALTSAYPRSLFAQPQAASELRCMAERFRSCVVAYFVFHPGDFTSAVSDVVPWFGAAAASGPSVVLFVTCAHACVLFVGDPEAVWEGTWNLLTKVEPRLSAGFLFTKYDVEVVMTQPPRVPEAGPVSYAEAHATVPTLTVEPLEVTRELPVLVQHLRDGYLLLSADLARLLAGCENEEGEELDGLTFRVVAIALHDEVSEETGSAHG
jgi:PAS domain S-box-containing protein